MSLVINQLTKIYGQQRAVDNISFTATKGEILGFLGPNGAGKSTTMKIATCYLTATTGTITVCGYDVNSFPLEVRKKIGYLPEHNPLYLDMYVREYLEFMGSLYAIKGKSLRIRIDEMIELCGLQREQHKLIGALSKGYRQRVGLAQAFLHDPEVLILDEPTTGLDPNQILEIRNLIRLISKDKTVIFSTHIMQEVKALCDRVVIINAGQLVANNPIAELQSHQNEQRLMIEFLEPITSEQLQTLPQVKSYQLVTATIVNLIAQPTVDLRPLVFRWAVDNQFTLIEMRKEETTLEKVFYELTQ